MEGGCGSWTLTAVLALIEVARLQVLATWIPRAALVPDLPLTYSVVPTMLWHVLHSSSKFSFCFSFSKS